MLSNDFAIGFICGEVAVIVVSIVVEWIARGK